MRPETSAAARLTPGAWWVESTPSVLFPPKGERRCPTDPSQQRPSGHSGCCQGGRDEAIVTARNGRDVLLRSVAGYHPSFPVLLNTVGLTADGFNEPPSGGTCFSVCVWACLSARPRRAGQSHAMTLAIARLAGADDTPAHRRRQQWEEHDDPQSHDAPRPGSAAHA